MTAHSWRPVDLSVLGDVEPPEPSIGGLSYPGSLAIVYGEPESVKTWLNLVVCLEQIRAGRSAVWIDHEMSAAAIRARLRDLGASDEEIARLLYLQPSEPITAPGALGDLASFIEAEQPAVCVVDAMAGAMALHQLDGNKGDDVERFYATLCAPLRAYGAAVHVVDHVVKDKETRGRWPIGSQRKLGAVDVGISVESVTEFGRGRTGMARLRVTKDRHGVLARPFVGELELGSDPVTGRISWGVRSVASGERGGNTWRPTHLMERVTVYLRSQREPVSRNAVDRAVPGKREYVLRAVDCLIEDGVVEESGPKRLVSLQDRFPVPDQFPPVPGNHSQEEPVPGSSLTTEGTTFGNRFEAMPT